MEDSFILLPQPNGTWVKIATSLDTASGVHTIKVMVPAE